MQPSELTRADVKLMQKNVALGYGLDHVYAQKLLDSYAALREAREGKPNNEVACVSCKQLVTVTALNAIRCLDCGPTPLAEQQVREATAKGLEEAAQECLKLKYATAHNSVEGLHDWIAERAAQARKETA